MLEAKAQNEMAARRGIHFALGSGGAWKARHERVIYDCLSHPTTQKIRRGDGTKADRAITEVEAKGKMI
jgi:hypothetical protein